MNQSFDDAHLIEAQYSTDLPGTADPKELPNEIQWQPPGEHEITASRGGKPHKMTVRVNEEGAKRVAAMHAKQLDAAEKGVGDRPFVDFNHEDREASAHVKGFRWGGDDPQKGGIRAKVEWTGAGKTAVSGRNFTRFSPSFYVDDDSGEVIGVPVNAGGLVNRAAFQRIAPIMSKQAEFEAIRAIKTDFPAAAQVLAKARNLDLDAAQLVLARENPDLYESYRFNVLGLGTAPAPSKRTTYSARYQAALADEFLIRARELSSALDLPVAAACKKLALAQPALYLRYRAKLDLGDGRDFAADVSSASQKSEESEFFVAAKKIAAERGIELSAAFVAAAHQNPALYDAYHASLLNN
ncbi:MAG TPA: phage protease [Chthoniobacterales bacterium]|jgi:hypothetical protein